MTTPLPAMNDDDVQAVEAELRTALEALETALATPLVEGELSDWSRQVEASWESVHPLVRHQLDVEHKKQFEEIAKADPEMYKRIEQMECEDGAIRDQIDRLSGNILHMQRRLPVAEGDPTAPINDEQTNLVNEGLCFVTQVRKQQVVVTTWLLEAFRRERGVAD